MIEFWTDDNGYTARVRVFDRSPLVNYECTLLAAFIGGSAGRFRICAPALVFTQYTRPARAVRPPRHPQEGCPCLSDLRYAELTRAREYSRQMREHGELRGELHLSRRAKLARLFERS